MDISVILYKPTHADCENLLGSLRTISRSYRRVWLLVSGFRSSHDAVNLVFGDHFEELRIDLWLRYDNLGFSSGHNRLLFRAFEEGASSVLVLNTDVSTSAHAIEQLLSVVARDNRLALYGPSLYRIEDVSRTPQEDQPKAIVDSLGIGWTRSGRHFDVAQGEERSLPSLVECYEALGVTGACLLVTGDVFQFLRNSNQEVFDEMFLAYREDAELGVRARSLGLLNVIVKMPGFWHVRNVRQFSRRNKMVNLLSVQNRFYMRWKLRSAIPGSNVLALMRDVLVVVAVVTIERHSLAGLRQGFRTRRTARYEGLKLRRLGADLRRGPQ